MKKIFVPVAQQFWCSFTETTNWLSQNPEPSAERQFSDSLPESSFVKAGFVFFINLVC